MKKTLMIIIALVGSIAVAQHQYAGSPGAWRTERYNNPMYDTPTVIVGQVAYQHTSGSKAPLLVIRCEGDTTQVFISWDDFISTGKHPVTARIGNSKPFTTEWGSTTNFKASSFIGNKIRFVKSLMAAGEESSINDLIFQVAPHGKGPITARFYAYGLSKAIEPLREACHW